jgi:hypothetical protein
MVRWSARFDVCWRVKSWTTAHFAGAAARGAPIFREFFPEVSNSTMISHVASLSRVLSERAEADRRMLSRQQNSGRCARAARRIGTQVLSWGMALAAAGCGSGDGHIKVAPVTGIVKYNGVPVRDAYVKFIQKGCPIVAGGFTNDAGMFELTSYQDGDGAPVGENQVTVTVMSRPSEDSGESLRQQAAAMEIQDPAERRKKLTELMAREKSARMAPPAAEPRSKIPSKYASESTSNLSFTVEAGTENECELDLTD